MMLQKTISQNQAPKPPSAIAIENWTPFQKNTLQGFLDLALPSGIIIRGCTYHVKNEARWISLPSRQYAKEDGTNSWTPIVEIRAGEPRKRFQAAALEALAKFLEGAQ